MKALAGHPKDLDDCAAIMAARADEFDANRTRMLPELLERAQSERPVADVRAVSQAGCGLIRRHEKR
jgi:hypothetical protein